MAKSFEINGKSYVAREFDYNMICDLQDAGIDMADLSKKGAASARAYLSVISGMSLADAGNEIGEHLMKGGTIDALIETMAESIEDSRFFRTLSEMENQETPTSTSKAKKESK